MAGTTPIRFRMYVECRVSDVMSYMYTCGMVLAMSCFILVHVCVCACIYTGNECGSAQNAIVRKAIADGSLCPPSCVEIQEYKPRRKKQIRKRPSASGRCTIGKKVKR